MLQQWFNCTSFLFPGQNVDLLKIPEKLEEYLKTLQDNDMDGQHPLTLRTYLSGQKSPRRALLSPNPNTVQIIKMTENPQ